MTVTFEAVVGSLCYNVNMIKEAHDRLFLGEIFLFCLGVGLVQPVSISSSTPWHYLINFKRFSQLNANKQRIQWHRG